MKKIKLAQSKLLLSDAVFFIDAVDEKERPIRRTEFPREHARNAGKINKMILNDTFVGFNEEGGTKNIPILEYQKMETKPKITHEGIKDGEMEFDESLWKTAKFFLESRSTLKLVSDEAYDEIDEFLKPWSEQ